MNHKFIYIFLLFAIFGFSYGLANYSDKIQEVNLEGVVLEFENNFSKAIQNTEDLFRLKLITVEGISEITEEDVIKIGAVKRGEFIWEISPTKIRKNLTENPWIDEVHFSWSLKPVQLHLQITQATPWLVGSFKDKIVLISTSRRVLAENIAFSDYPELIKLSSKNYYAHEIKKINDAYSTIRSLEMSEHFPPFELREIILNEDVGVKLIPLDVSKPEVLVISRTLNEAEDTLVRLSRTLKEIELDQRKVREIDLRFSAQAILRN